MAYGGGEAADKTTIADLAAPYSRIQVFRQIRLPNLIAWFWSDLGPALGHRHRIAETDKELLLGIITLPPATQVEIDEMGAPPVNEIAPLVRNRVERKHRSRRRFIA